MVDHRQSYQPMMLSQMAIIFNAVFLTTVHSYASAASTNATNETSYSNSSPLQAFLDRLQENGIENIDPMDMVFFGCVVLLGLELINVTVKQAGQIMRLNNVPVRGKHLDDLSQTDILFISLNKIATVPFAYFLAKFLYYEPNAIWSFNEVTFINTIVPIAPLFIIYDFFYTLLHWALHIQAIYGYIHKHHHRQKAPSRASVDAVNVHPIEFFLGEYNHIFAIFIYTACLGQQIHLVSVGIFFLTGAVLASLNHTRFDANIRVFGVSLYDSKWHDVHHRIPQSNYGQYINLWDRVFGSFRKYDPNDRVNPLNQLNFQTGKSLSYKKVD